MATTYKQINSPDPVVLTARAFADGIDIHPAHRLRGCTVFQWKYDNLLGGAVVDAPGTSNEQNYTVDLSTVDSSGEYYCEIDIGTTGECDRVTDRRRISIISCSQQTDRTFGPIGAFGTFEVVAPHFEAPAFSNEGNDWIVEGILVGCPTSTEVSCTFVQNFTLVDQTSAANQARRGQPSLTVGDFVCFYGTVQNYIRTEAGDGEAPDQPDGAFIILTQDGPAEVGGTILITATVGIVGGTLVPTDGIVSFSPFGSPEQLTEQSDPDDPESAGVPINVWTTTYTEGTLVSATISSRSSPNAFAEASAQIDISFTPGEPAPERAVITGRTTGSVNCFRADGTTQGNRVRNGSFRVEDGGFFDIVIVHEPDGVFGPTDFDTGVVTGGRFQLRGPGAEDALVVAPRNITQDSGGVSGAPLGVEGFQISGITGVGNSIQVAGREIPSGPVTQVIRVTGAGNYSWGLQSGRFLQSVRPEFRSCAVGDNPFRSVPEGSQQRTSFSIRT